MKLTVASIIIAGALMGGAVILSQSTPNDRKAGPVGNASIVNGKQVVVVTAKGGYSPVTSIAKADMQTTLRVQTSGTFDCSSALTIPALGYRVSLPPTGVTEIEIPPQKAGTNLRGLCAMGMYNFSIDFK